MKNVVKLIALITITAVISGLVACGSAQSTTTSGDSTVQTQQSPTAGTTDTAESASTGSSLKDLRISITDVPTKTVLAELIKPMQEIYKDGQIPSNVYPAARAFESVKNGTADMLIPYIYDPKIKDDSIIYSSESLF
jgi:hypothetical protein